MSHEISHRYYFYLLMRSREIFILMNAVMVHLFFVHSSMKIIFFGNKTSANNIFMGEATANIVRRERGHCKSFSL
jgi:hypothetical protein